MNLLAKKCLSTKPFLLFSIFTCLALIVRFFLASQELVYLDRLFLPDDAYYILTISRSIVAGIGPSIDGIHLTSGFQPLIALLQLPIFSLEPTADHAVVLAIYLSAFWGGLSTLLLGYLLLNLSGMRAAIIASLLWIFCPIIIKNDLNAMETSLAGFFSLSVLLCAVLSDKEKTILRFFCLGLACGLAILARVDTCFLLITIGIFAFISWGWRSTAFVVLVALIIVAPWWLYSLKTFGTVVPESGAAIKELIAYHGMPQGYISLASLYALIDWVPYFPLAAPTALVGIIITFYLIFNGAYQTKLYSLILIIPMALQLLFYTAYFPAFWFYTRYYYFIYIVILIMTSLFLGAKRGDKAEQVSLLAVVILLISFVIYLVPFLDKPTRSDCINGYREVALAIRTYLSPGSTIGALQSGALAYYTPKSVRVINLDGVVNKEAAKAIEQKQMKAYVDSQNLTYFADWAFNAGMFRAVYGGVFPEPCFIPIYRAKKQCKQQFTLYTYQAECDLTSIVRKEHSGLLGYSPKSIE